MDTIYLVLVILLKLLFLVATSALFVWILYHIEEN